MGAPWAANFMKEIRFPARSAIPTTMTLGKAPMGEPLPPRQAPKARDHQTGMRSGCCSRANPLSWGQSC